MVAEYQEYLVEQDVLELFFWSEPCNYYTVKVSETLELHRSEHTGEVVGVVLHKLKNLIVSRFLEDQLNHLR